ncbi:sugar ABC transporter permease [Curvibacter sp. CHRR-16]|uniref:carbohydrate ABC transporter permease n=1 Tax=Curvibacter sp. CHRR-16 TaxID=2835872 RepID=UPI001BD997C0|nr:sugar ABC transporter permease [Curvibacter sp. CHRR-16]MBT0570308.1 sugar ABC transporter permease [Curvibacter sp. CHRR-16]
MATPIPQSPSSYRRFYDINGWLFVSATLALMAGFMVYPIVKSLWMSLHAGPGMLVEFVGWGNVVRLSKDPVFLQALTNTCIFLVVQVPIMLVLALVLASCLNMPQLRLRGLWRTIVFLPCVTSLVAYSVLFKSMFSYDGVINHGLLALHIISEPIAWLNDPFWAKVVIISAITWRWTGYNMIFYLAAMQNIDKSIYEAARIDGISAYRRFVSITIPMLKPVILFTTVTSTIGTLQLFDEPMNITSGLNSNGNPANATLTLSMYIYNLSFKFVPNFGYAATVSYVIVAIVAVLAYLQFLAAKDK